MNRTVQETQTLFEAAADWFLRLRNPAVSSGEISEWIAWCDADPQNRQAFMDIQQLWSKAGALPEQAIAQTELDADCYASEVSIREWRSIPAARSRLDDCSLSKPFPLKGEARASREGEFIPVQRRRTRATHFARAAAIILIIVGGVWTFELVDVETADVKLTSPPGKNRELRLPDHSAVTLAAGSQLAVEYTAAARDVFLNQGEAFFNVKKDTQRPFVVHTPGATVTALGTAFNVRAEEGIVRVTVTEGIVDVGQSLSWDQSQLHQKRDQRAASSSQLSAGYEITLARERPKPLITPVDAKHATAWMEGTLRFVDEPLASVVAAVNRYAETQVKLETFDVGELHFTGTVVVDSVDEWLRGLPNIFPVTVRRSGETAVIGRKTTSTSASTSEN